MKYLQITITELSELTGKTRPTIYSYQKNYENGVFDKVPFSFIKLFEMIEGNQTRPKIINYCKNTFGSKVTNKMTEVNSLIKNLSDEQIDSLLNLIKKEINK